MIGGIREAMRVPMAAPPGRRPFMSRFGPEVCAGVVYAFAGVLAAMFHDEEHPILIGALCGYGVAWLIMLLGPVSAGAQAVAGEWERGAAEALVLTPGDHGRLGAGR